MEERVIHDFEFGKQELFEKLKQRFGEKFSADDLEFIRSNTNKLVQDMIELMRVGKSAHEKFYSDIIINSNDAIIGLDNEFKIFLWNKGAENIFGYKKEEIMKKDFEILLPDYKLKEGEKEFLLNEVKLKGSVSNYESDRITKYGKIIHISMSRYPVYNEKNEQMGSVGIVRDITTVKSLEKELRERENLALIGEVVSSIAHSLSNPLNIISGNADYLLLDRKENDDGYEELKTILDEATRITKSIRHLLNFSRPLNLTRQHVDINVLIEDILSNIKYITGNKKIIFKKILDRGIKEFLIDKDQIWEAILNILTNSIQAISQDGEIKIITNQQDDKIILIISDNGHGISKENLDHIFLPFFSSKGYGKGTGLGLPITRRIIREHKGEIDVKSIVGKGTTFTVSLPYKIQT
jgi:PAS domain S-box-containing protein